MLEQVPAPHCTHTLPETERTDLHADVKAAGGARAYCRKTGLREHVLTRLLAGLPVLEASLLMARMRIAQSRNEGVVPRPIRARRPRKAKPSPVEVPAAAEPPPAAA